MRVEPYPISWPAPYEIPTDGCPPVARSKGLHVSTILRSVGIRMRWINEENGSDFGMHLGIAFENYAAVMVKHELEKRGSCFDFHPGEFIVDDLAMNPDGVEITPEGKIILHEFKSTVVKVSKAIDDQWYWLAQVQAYCRALDSLEAVLHIAHLAGHHQPPFPLLNPVHLIFTKQDLEDNWRMILREAKNV